MSAIPVNLAVEDDLSEAVLKRLLMHTARGFAIGTVYGHSGYGYLRSTIGGWNTAARGIPFVILTDLDEYACPMALIEQWIPHGRHTNLLFALPSRSRGLGPR